MVLKKSHVILAEKIITIFEKGISISADMLFFAESTYGFMSFREFATALSDNGFDDREVLTGLIFFPDLSVRLIMEPLIGETVLTPQDEFAIAEYVGNRINQVKMVLPDKTHYFYAGHLIPNITHFIEKLCLRRTLSPGICSALETHLPESLSLISKVLLRTSKVSLSSNTERLLCMFIEKAKTMEDRFLPHFEVVLSLLGQVPVDMPIPDFLFAKRQAYETMLAQIQDFDRVRSRYGLEYLLMNRFPVPHESEAVIQNKLQMLDTIIFDILNLQPGMGPVQAELGAFDPEHDTGRLLKIIV